MHVTVVDSFGGGSLCAVKAALMIAVLKNSFKKNIFEFF